MSCFDVAIDSPSRGGHDAAQIARRFHCTALRSADRGTLNTSVPRALTQILSRDHRET